MKRIHVHPEAKAEAKGSFDWYWERTPSAAVEFDEALREAYARIRQNPQAWSPYLHGTRRLVLDPYPYSVVFRERLHDIQIIAVAHAKRRPGYWNRRLRQ